MYEAVLRRTGRTWLWRYYEPVGRGLLEKAGKFGPTALSEQFRSPLADASVADLPEVMRPAALSLEARSLA